MEELLEYYDVLKDCTLFQNIRPDHIFGLLNMLNARSHTFLKNRTILREGQNADYFGIVVSGKIQLDKYDFSGNKSIYLQLSPPDIFAESFAFSGLQCMTVNVTAVERTDVIMIDSRRLMSMWKNTTSHSEPVEKDIMNMGLNLLTSSANKNMLLSRRINIMTRRTVREKLMAYLNDMSVIAGSTSIDIPYSREQLAEYLSVDRSGLSREISLLRSEGILKCRKSHFEILNKKEDLR